MKFSSRHQVWAKVTGWPNDSPRLMLELLKPDLFI